MFFDEDASRTVRVSEEGSLMSQPGAQELQMVRLSITFDGRYYHLDCFRYGKLIDAVNYAMLKRNRSFRMDGETVECLARVERPDLEDQRHMAASNVSFENGVYCFQSFHYDRLVDALNYSRQLFA